MVEEHPGVMQWLHRAGFRGCSPTGGGVHWFHFDKLRTNHTLKRTDTRTRTYLQSPLRNRRGEGLEAVYSPAGRDYHQRSFVHHRPPPDRFRGPKLFVQVGHMSNDPVASEPRLSHCYAGHCFRHGVGFWIWTFSDSNFVEVAGSG